MKVLSETEQLALAIAKAATGHLNQTDKGGKPYILHPLKVMRYIRSDDPQLMAIAVMHDIVEDTDETIESLREAGFSDRVLAGVNAMTKKPGQSEQAYMSAIICNPDAIRVKLADLRHNTDVRRLKGLEDKDLLRMRKYHKMHKTLETALKNYETIGY